MSKTSKRPDYVNDNHLIYLDELRKSGITNMWGARTFLSEEFEHEQLDDKTAGKILYYWMDTFGGDDSTR